MAQNNAQLQPLMPRPKGSVQQSRPSVNRKREKVSNACVPCRQRKSKCDSQQPCSKCTELRTECNYIAKSEETQMQALKRKYTELQTRSSALEDIYNLLRNKPSDDDANKILEAIQSGLEPHELLAHLRTSQESEPAYHATQASSSSTRPDSTPTNNESTAAQGLLEPSKFMKALEDGIEAFFGCTSCIFHIYEREEADEFLTIVRECINSIDKAWPDLIFRDSVSIRQKSSLCSVCIMAAVGLQYTKHPIPALGFMPSSESGAFHYVKIFYEMTKHLLEASIENHILEAMKICAALCVFNIASHVTVALANADMGLNFALNLGPGFHHCPPGMSEASWTSYKRVTRTLITLRGWLVTSLGYVYSDNPGLQIAINHLVGREVFNPTEVIQQELAKVVQIEANLLLTVDSFNNLSPSIFSSTRKDLAKWHQQLPQWMHLDALMKPEELPLGVRRTVFLVHLFYLTANMLVARLAHNRVSSSPLQYCNEETTAAGDGIMAAQTASRILQLQLDEQTIFQNCWLCIFTSYTAGLMLLHSSAQLLLHGYPQPVCGKELFHVKSCINVLEHCAHVNQVAQRFNDTLRSYYDVLAPQSQYSEDLANPNMPTEFDYLFTIPPSPPLDLSQILQDLIQLVSRPFDYASNLHTEGILMSGFRSQLD